MGGCPGSTGGQFSLLGSPSAGTPGHSCSTRGPHLTRTTNNTSTIYQHRIKKKTEQIVKIIEREKKYIIHRSNCGAASMMLCMMTIPITSPNLHTCPTLPCVYPSCVSMHCVTCHVCSCTGRARIPRIPWPRRTVRTHGKQNGG